MPNVYLVPDWLQVQYCSSSKSLETFALMVSIQAWVIRIWSRVIRTSDEAPGFFTVTPNDLIFWLRHHWLHSWFLFQRRRNFFSLRAPIFQKEAIRIFFFNLESISGQTDDISQQTFSGDQNRKTGGIFFSVDRTQSPKMMVILESQLFLFSRYRNRNRWSFNFRSGIIYRFILLRFGLEFDVIQNYKLGNEPVSTEEFMVIDF